MSDVWFISDTHFGHKNILTFKNKDGSLLRPFKDIEEHDETIVKNWNSVVKPTDKVYHLGDIAMGGSSLPILKRLNGHKRLVRGNHDAENTSKYFEYFKEIYGVRVFGEGFICSHIPIHPDSLSRWALNVHGHLHGNTVPDKRYLSVCCEQVNYTPVNMQFIIEKINESLISRGF